MADNPIEYKDFIKPDDSIEKLIGQLEQVQKRNEELKKSLIQEAKALQIELSKTNNATEKGRKATREAATDADRLSEANKKLAKSQEAVSLELADLKLKQQDQNRINKLTAKLNSSLEGSYDKLSAQYSLNKIKLNKMTAAERSSTVAGKKLEKQTKDIYKEMNRLQKATGKHQLQVGTYGIATENLHPILGRLNSNLASMGTNLQSLGKADKPFKALSTAVVNFGRATLAFLLSPVGLALTALGSLFYLISRNKDTVIEFNDSLINVGKTADLQGEELRGFGQDIVELSRKLKVIGTPALLQYTKVAGQLGVKGRENILAFAESLAKLETATNISGEEGASNITRLLTLTDGGVQNVSDFGDEIVNLGNNFAATENEILTNATAIAQNTAQYKVGRKSVLAYATATKAVGLEAEITGSTIGRTLGRIEKAIRTGKGIDEVAKMTGRNVEDLKTQFREDPGAVFSSFIAGLNEVNKAGGSVNGQLEKIGITSIRDQRVISSLATAGFDVLKKSIDEVSKSSGSLDKEYDAASKKLRSQLNRVGIAWDNLVLSIEDGEGWLGKVAAFFAGELSKSIDRVSSFIRIMGATISGVIAVFKEWYKEAGNFITSVKGIAGIDIDLRKPFKSLKSIQKALGDVKTTFIEGAKKTANAFGTAFKSELERSTNVAKKALEKSGEELDKILDDSIKKSIESIGEIDQEISRLNKTLDSAKTRGEAKTIQDEIKALEGKRNAILGVANARLKEVEKRAMSKQKAKIDVMEEGESKDVAILELELTEKKKLWEKYNLDVALLDDYEKKQRFLISKKWRDKEIAETEKSQKEAYQNNVTQYDQEYDLELSRIDAMQALEAEKTKLRLEAEKDRLQKILALNKKGEGDLSQLQIEAIKNTIKAIQGEIDNTDYQNKDIYSVMGLKLDNEEKQAISDSVGYAVSGMQDLLAARIATIDQALSKNSQEGDAIRSRLEQEQQYRLEGLAFSETEARKELEINERKEKELLKQKRRAQKQQEAIDTVIQATNLITAASGIWKNIGSTNPILALTTIGLMFGSFAAAKVRARAVTRDEFGEGGFEVLKGGSHASGNDIPMNFSNGRQIATEGGEAFAVINKKSTAKYRSLLPSLFKSINAGSFERSFAQKMHENRNSIVMVNENNSHADLSSLERGINTLVKQGERNVYTDELGRRVVQYKNIKRIYV